MNHSVCYFSMGFNLNLSPRQFNQLIILNHEQLILRCNSAETWTSTHGHGHIIIAISQWVWCEN